MLAKIGRGFSLIELMVVVAIVAVLAAIAVPAYQKYILSSRAATFMPTIDNIIEQMTEYANTHGRFPNQYLLGLTTTPLGNVDDPAALNPHLSLITFNDISTEVGHPAPCGANGRVEVIATNQNAVWLGMPAIGLFIITCNLDHHDGVINKKCFTLVTDDYIHTIPGNILPGTTNSVTGYNFDYTNLDAFRASSDYTATDCM